MLLRDSQGEITVMIGDLFQVRTGIDHVHVATLEALCPDSRSGISNPPICCRIFDGSLLFEGKLGEVGDLLNCTPEVVAAGVRSYRGKGLSQPVPLRTEQSEFKPRRARETLERNKSDQPTPSESLSLFD